MPSAQPRQMLVPLIVACGLFMENLDSTVLSTALPAIARSLEENPLHLSLAMTAYLFSLAVFIPISGWVADRFGARTVFRAAIVIFTLGSILCGLSDSLPQFVLARIFQGFGGAMMVPVGRLVLLRSVAKAELVRAMAWLTVPALIGPVLGPPLGGFITTYLSWRWIFWINVPIGLLGVLLVTLFIADIREERPPPFDWRGFALLGVALIGLVVGFETVARGFLPGWRRRRAVRRRGRAAGALCPARPPPAPRRARSRAAAHPDLPRQHRRRLPVPHRHRRHALPAAADAADRLRAQPLRVGPADLRGRGRRAAHEDDGGPDPAPLRLPPRADRQRRPERRASWPRTACSSRPRRTGSILAVLLVGGFFRSLQFTSINTIAYADMPRERMSRATSFASVGQQLSLSVGVGTGALLLHLTVAARGDAQLAAQDFAPAFFALGLLAALSALVHLPLPADAGAEVSGHVPRPTATGAARTQPGE